uniref:ADF-H domain-containing protein n=1 Tax=Pyramimonas obovata TaxID=1411642 RepID=A0A7S0MP50_9CHLO|mmetsp:Transcript_10027/g.20931  ORF Transcript_10027/g.20931 Transcript_10027/m.20931 type:complete len:313 (+) Transcript_10027:156-1094(+)
MASFEASCQDAYQKVFSDTDPSDWCTLGYSGRKLTALSCSTGGLKAAIDSFDDAQVMYTLVRLSKTDDGGDSKRVKFVFLTWVGENAPAMKKGQVGGVKTQVADLFKGYHIEKQIFDRPELDGLEAELDTMLKKAGGANYDMGNINAGVKAGDSAAIKNASKSFFMQKDKETEIKSVVFEKNISNSKKITACDLGGRAMTAPPTAAKANTVGYDSGSPSAEVVKEDSPAPAPAPAAEPAKPAKAAAVEEPAPAAEEEPAPAVEEATPAAEEAAPESEEAAAPAAEEPASPAETGAPSGTTPKSSGKKKKNKK